MPGAPDLSHQAAQLKRLGAQNERLGTDATQPRYALYDRACRLRRRITLANPLLDFDRIVFLTKHRPMRGDHHMVDQYYGFNARPGGGVYVLNDVFSDQPISSNLLSESLVQNGRLAGKALSGGAYNTLDLDYDGRTLLFAWSQCGEPGADVSWSHQPWSKPQAIASKKPFYYWSAETTYNLFRTSVEGQQLTQLTDTLWNEFDPVFLPGGRIAFISERRGGFLRCGENRPNPVFTLFGMQRDGTDIFPLSYHETQEWNPSVDNDGMITYTRWDYVDRDNDGAHHIWVCHPDGHDPRGEVYGTPWPLSELFHLCVYDPGQKHYGIYLIDGFGNKELIWRDPKVAALDPIPLRPRPRPPILPARTTQASADRGQADHAGPATISVMNIYASDFDWPPETRITGLRVIQLFPKSTYHLDDPEVGLAHESLVRGALGVVPVEADGSVYFEAPVGVPIYFQALDEQGRAVQSMRSATYVHRGEQMTCVGCHENKHHAPPPPSGTPLAILRAPSKLTQTFEGADPIFYPRLVQPVLDRHCVDCHQRERALDLTGGPGNPLGWTRSYVSLAPFAWGMSGGNGIIVNNGMRSIPGQIGTRASKLMKLLDAGHYDVSLPADDLRRITLWLDCNSNFYGAYHDCAKQSLGEQVTPELQ